MYKEITKCRICGNTDLIPILNLGNMYLTGIFPKAKKENVISGPLELIKCHENSKTEYCGLLQLKQTYDLNEMYGLNYGYRSGLNQSMATHLKCKVKNILKKITIVPEDIIIDIGSNDSTLLQSYPQNSAILVGIDPTGKKFKKYYPDYIQLIPDFFSAKAFKKKLTNLINCESLENDSNTPDFIIAEYLVDCLKVFNKTTKTKKAYYSQEPSDAVESE